VRYYWYKYGSYWDYSDVVHNVVIGLHILRGYVHLKHAGHTACWNSCNIRFRRWDCDAKGISMSEVEILSWMLPMTPCAWHNALVLHILAVNRKAYLSEACREAEKLYPFNLPAWSW
jgi:hypothetical protein